MHISTLKIRNFRNFSSSTFTFHKGVNTLLGENASGKTNAFYAIQLMLDDSLSRRATKLVESDFNRALPRWRGHWVIISIEFDELDTSEGCQILRHTCGNMNGESKGTYTFIYRPKIEIRRKLYELSEIASEQERKSAAEDILGAIRIEDYEDIFTARATADFTDDECYQSLVGNFQNCIFPDPDNEQSDIIGVKNRNIHQTILNEVSCTFVKALRDVVSDLKSYRDNPLLSILKGSEKKITVEDATTIETKVDELNSAISDLDEVKTISGGLQNTLHSTVGHTYSPNIGIESILPSEIERLLQRLALKVGDDIDEYRGDISELSLGGANLIFLALKLLEYNLKLASDRAAHFLLIEEPEAHIHTHIQKTLFDKYGQSETQVFVSTHSTHLSAASQIESVNILGRDKMKVNVFYPANGLRPIAINRIQRYLDAVRTTLLFARGVIVVEGDAELILLPTLVKTVFGLSLDEIGVSLINMSNTAFTNIATLFHEDRIKRNCAIITDLDASIVPAGYTPQSDTDKKFVSKCQNSQTAGADRKVILDDFCSGNQWVAPFYASHTFEVDFILAGNTQVVIDVLPNIYSRPTDIENSKDLLSSAAIHESGREILRLAEKEGKGWFALLLGEKVTHQTLIPDYVLQALCFAAQNTINSGHLITMIKYRLTKIGQADETINNQNTTTTEDVDRVIAQFVDQYPTDQLSCLINYVKS